MDLISLIKVQFTVKSYHGTSLAINILMASENNGRENVRRATLEIGNKKKTAGTIRKLKQIEN